jgi:ABC-type transport system involved in cytochrome bd biosynthesis fused ATPase/permease subunit
VQAVAGHNNLLLYDREQQQLHALRQKHSKLEQQHAACTVLQQFCNSFATVLMICEHLRVTEALSKEVGTYSIRSCTALPHHELLS